MARARMNTRRTGRTRKTTARSNPPAPRTPIVEPPKRGVKLKHFSNFIMLLALLCLLAYLAGRVDVSAATSAPDRTRAAAGLLAPNATNNAKVRQQSSEANKAKESTVILGLRTVKYEVQDIAKAKEWYGKAFGIQPYFDEPAYYVGYNIGGYELGLVPEPKSSTKRDAAGVAYWGVDDVRAEYKRLLDLGATSVSDVQDVGGGILVAEVRDPFGNVIGIIYNPHFKVGETK